MRSGYMVLGLKRKLTMCHCRTLENATTSLLQRGFELPTQKLTDRRVNRTRFASVATMGGCDDGKKIQNTKFDFENVERDRSVTGLHCTSLVQFQPWPLVSVARWWNR